MSSMRMIHALAAWLFAASVVIQAFLAGVAIVNLGGDGNFAPHIEFGYTAVGILTLAVLITAIVARIDRRQVALCVGLLVLYIVQTSLPFARESYPWVAALHPANAMVLLLLAIAIARRAQARVQAPTPTSGPSVSTGGPPPP